MPSNCGGEPLELGYLNQLVETDLLDLGIDLREVFYAAPSPAFDDSYAEINGIVKNEYLDSYDFVTMNELSRAVKRTMSHYN